MLLQKLVELIAPHECLVCGHEGSLVCRQCLPEIVITKQPTCWRCNRLSPGGRTCKSCRPSSALAGVSVVSHYEEYVKALIHALKYQQAAASADLAAELMIPLLQSTEFDLVTSVPAAPKRFRARGFNQSELIARGLARKLQLPYATLLGRSSSVRQVGMDRRHRFEQIKGAFYPIRTTRSQSARILLIDDVLTTGATLNQCAKVLKANGAKRVWGAVLAKH